MSPQRLKKHNIAVDIRKPVRGGKKITSDDLLPESREFLSTRTGGNKKEHVIRLRSAKESRELKEIDAEKEYRYKKMAMWSGVTFFMIIIIVVWGWNINKSFRKTNAEMSRNSNGKSLTEITADLSKAMDEFKKTADQINNAVTSQPTATTTATSTAEYNMAGINALKNRLESASSTASSTEKMTATATPKIKN